MRILILSQYFYPEVGATQTRMYEFARHLAGTGHDVVVVTEFPNHPAGRIPNSYRGKWFEEEQRDGFRIVRVWVWTSPTKNFRTRMLFYNSFLALATVRALFLKKLDVVFATSPPLFVGAAGYAISRIKRCRFVLDVRDLWPSAALALGELRNPRLVSWAEKAESFLYRKADLVTAVTRGFCRHIEGFGVQPEKVVWLPNGTLPELFKPGPPDIDFRRKTGMPDRFLVMFAGTLGIAQGLPALLEAAEICLDDPTIGFVLVGDGPMRARLVQQREGRRLHNVWFEDQVPLEEAPRLLNSSDALLVSLSRDPVFDTFVPSKLFDSMACGKPVLLGVDGEARSILEEAKAGLHFEPENPAALLKAIRILRENHDLRRTMGRNGRQFALANFDRKRQAKGLASLLATVVSKSR